MEARRCRATCFLSTDHLGSTRALTDSTGTVVERHDYLPFGEEIYAGVGTRTSTLKFFAYNDAAGPLAQKFTSKERDAETGLEFLEMVNWEFTLKDGNHSGPGLVDAPPA